MLIADIRTKSADKVKELVQLAEGFYSLEQAMAAIGEAQKGLRAVEQPLREIQGDGEHLTAALHELEQFVEDHAKARQEMFERFQRAAFALLEPDLGITGVRGRDIVVRHLVKGKVQRIYPDFRYARIDIVPGRSDVPNSLTLYIGEDAGENGAPNTAGRSASMCRWHRYQPQARSGESWQAQFV